MVKGMSADLSRTLRLMARAASFTSSSIDIDLPLSLLLGLWRRERVEEEEEECMGIRSFCFEERTLLLLFPILIWAEFLCSQSGKVDELKLLTIQTNRLTQPQGEGGYV